MLAPSMETPSCWIIAFGNSRHRDGGIGPYVARRLDGYVQHMSGVSLCTLPQLDISLLEEIHGADHLIFVDAGGDGIDNGLRWSPVKPELNGWAMGSHDLTPTVFLGLLHLLYQSKPSAWTVSVRGRDVEPGEDPSAEARRDAERAAVQIVDWLHLHGITLDAQKDREKEPSHA